MTAATTLCGLQGVGRRRHHRFNQEGREAEGGQRSRATRIKGVESKVEKCLFLTKWFDPLDLSKQKELLDLGYTYIPQRGRWGGSLIFFFEKVFF